MAWLDDTKREIQKKEQELDNATQKWKTRRIEAFRLLDDAFKKISPVVDRLLKDLERDLGFRCCRPQKWQLVDARSTMKYYYYEEVNNGQDLPASFETLAYTWEFGGTLGSMHHYNGVLCLVIDDSGRPFLEFGGEVIYTEDLGQMEIQLKRHLKEHFRHSLGM